MTRRYSAFLGILLFTAALLGWSSPGQAASVAVCISGPNDGFGYTVQIINSSTGAVVVQDTKFIITGGGKARCWAGLANGNYYAKVWANSAGIKSNTWPAKNASGSGYTQLGCLAFDYSDAPTPWIGACPAAYTCW